MPDTEQSTWDRSGDEAPAAPKKASKIKRLLVSGIVSAAGIVFGTVGLGMSATPAFAYTGTQAEGQTIYELGQVGIYNPPYSGPGVFYEGELESCTYLGTNTPNVPQWNCYGSDEWFPPNSVIQCQEQFQFGPNGALLYSHIDYGCGT